MTNKAFYAFCRDQRKVELDEYKRAALQDVYKFLFECGVSRQGVTRYIEHRLSELANDAKLCEAYVWLRRVFAGETQEVSR